MKQIAYITQGHSEYEDRLRELLDASGIDPEEFLGLEYFSLTPFFVLAGATVTPDADAHAHGTEVHVTGVRVTIPEELEEAFLATPPEMLEDAYAEPSDRRVATRTRAVAVSNQWSASCVRRDPRRAASARRGPAAGRRPRRVLLQLLGAARRHHARTRGERRHPAPGRRLHLHRGQSVRLWASVLDAVAAGAVWLVDGKEVACGLDAFVTLEAGARTVSLRVGDGGRPTGVSVTVVGLD